MLLLHETGHFADWRDGSRNSKIEAGHTLELKIWCQDPKDQLKDLNPSEKFTNDYQCEVSKRNSSNVKPTMFKTFNNKSTNAKSNKKGGIQSPRFF